MRRQTDTLYSGSGSNVGERQARFFLPRSKADGRSKRPALGILAAPRAVAMAETPKGRT